MKIKVTNILAMVIVLSVFTTAGIAQQTNPTQQFYNNVNSSWQSQSYAQLLALINARLQSNPNDVWALFLKAEYYTFAQKDVTQAHQAANAFVSVVNNGTRSQALRDQAQAMVKEILAIPTSENTPYTQSQLNSIHSLFPTFPSLDDGMIFWAQFTGQT